MATLLLQAAGAALGSVFGPVGSAIGQAVGALAGASIDRALIGGGSTVTGARLATARIPGADEGTAITRLYGTARIGGTLFWATRFEEEVTTERSGWQGLRRRWRCHDHELPLFRQFRRWALRRRGDGDPSRLGGRSTA